MRFWGKLHLSADNNCAMLPLAHHCIDVASVFRALCDLPGVRHGLVGALANGDASEVLLDRLAVFALLHDIGKCNIGFQAKRDPSARNTAGHVREVLPLFLEDSLREKAIQAIGLHEMGNWFIEPDSLFNLLLVSISHHGKPAFIWDAADGNDIRAMLRHWRPDGNLDPFVGLSELGDTARRVFPRAFQESAPPMVVSIELEHRFAGLVMLADWLGSHREAFFPFEHEGDRIEWSRQQARKALAAVGLDVAQARHHIAKGLPSFGTVFNLNAEPRPLQATLASADLRHC